MLSNSPKLTKEAGSTGQAATFPLSRVHKQLSFLPLVRCSPVHLPSSLKGWLKSDIHYSLLDFLTTITTFLKTWKTALTI